MTVNSVSMPPPQRAHERARSFEFYCRQHAARIIQQGSCTAAHSFVVMSEPLNDSDALAEVKARCREACARYEELLQDVQRMKDVQQAKCQEHTAFAGEVAARIQVWYLASDACHKTPALTLKVPSKSEPPLPQH